MNITKTILAFFAAILMILSTGATAFAMPGGGAEKSENYTVGVDLSVFNIGGKNVLNYDSVDFAKMKADGCDFAILRLGFTAKATREHTLDLAFLEYYNRARAAGMKLGVYFYSIASTPEESISDAEWVISVIEENDMYFEYPIYYDVEEGVHYGMNGENLTKLCLGWSETLEKAGYFPGVYGRDSILNKLSADFRSRYDVWVRFIKSDAQNAVQYSPETENVSERASLWQYTMYQRFDGCTVQYTSNQLDGNISYKDYTKIMVENGYNNCENMPEPEPETESSEDTSVSAEESVSSEESVSAEESVSLENNENEESENRKTLIVAIAVLVVALGGILAVVLMFRKK